MPRSNSTIAADHHPWLAIESLDVAVLHRVTNNPGAAVAHDLHVELDRSDSLAFADPVHVLELVIGMRAATDDRDVRRPADVGEPTRHVNRIVMPPTRNQHSNSRAPRV